MNFGTKPSWLTFDCYGTLIQRDEGLIAAIERVVLRKQKATVNPARFIALFDRHGACAQSTRIAEVGRRNHIFAQTCAASRLR